MRLGPRRNDVPVGTCTSVTPFAPGRAMNRVVPTLLALLLLAPAPARAQEQDPLAELLGEWRLQGRTAQGEALGGKVRFLPGGRYEREVRLEREATSRLERGDVIVRDGALLLRADARPGLVHLGQAVDLGDPARTRYRLGQPVLEGARRESGGAVGREALERWRPDLDGNAVELLIDGEAFARMREAIAQAREQIEVQTFQWGDDATGRGIAEMLMAKARQGVRVRCLVDASSKTVNDLIARKDITAGLDDEMRAAGVEVIHAHGYVAGVGNSILDAGRALWDGARRLFGGSPPAHERRGVMNHDHRKLLIVDRRVAFVGGMNIAWEYEHEWHDVQARVEGPAAHDVHELFVDRWNAACGRRDRPMSVGERPTFSRAPGDVRVEVLGSVPGVDASIRDMYLREIAAARRTIMIEVAYFLDDRIIEALAAAVRRGVRTIVVIPSDEKNDVYLVKEAFAWVHDDVVRSGVELYFYQPRLVHSKLAAFDGERATVGSSNLDRMALDGIAEANIYVPDARFAREIERRIFAVDLPQCERAVERPLPWRRKIVSGTLHFFRGLL